MSFSNIERIREGIGDKLGLLIRGLTMFVASVGIAFFFQWRVALLMFGVAPISCFITSSLSIVFFYFKKKKSNIEPENYKSHKFSKNSILKINF